ncbi:extracellular solute-binding protein [Xylanimonas allomyrinae]|uniref:Extracellular solute-binding protein n=1 Tax=Xylanimonas allomyrinae TaxID=2509459 RepID=A0A4P6EJR6_9MICO|nr:extracellular solute-binding protein [Xylanimonas allomyrinae]QAY62812.1 extracellular solute-binding protein [Xylanimonas allomyrinae]
MKHHIPLRPGRRASARRRRLAVGAVAALAALAPTACSNDAPAPAANLTGEPSGTLTYWFAPFTPDAQGVADWKRFNVDPFVALHPDVDLQTVQKGLNVLDRQLQVALAAGTGPDLIIAPGVTNQIAYAQAGFLHDLTPFAAENAWSDHLLPWAQEIATADGKLVTLPQSYETLVLFYNKTLFAEHGWVPPTNRQELERLAAQMTAAGVTPFAAGNSDYPAGTEWLVSALLNSVAGAEKVHDALSGTVPWTDPAFAQTIDLLKEYFDAGWFGGGVRQYFATTDPVKYAQFASGEAGMYISGTWEFVTLPEFFDQSGAEFDWAPVPPLADGVPTTFPLSVGGALSVNANTKNPLAAQTYLDWILKDSETMWAQVAATGANPMPVTIDDADIPSEVDPRFARVYTSLSEASEAGLVGYTTWTSWGAQSNQFIVDNTDKVLSDVMTTETFLQGLDAAFQEDLRRGNVPAVFSTGKPAAR